MRVLPIILSMLACAGFAQTLSRQEQFILDLSKKKFDWLIQRQYDSLQNFLDDKMQYIHSSGWVQNKQEVIEDLRSGKLNYQKATLKESSVRFYGTTAIVTGLGTFEGITDGKPFTLELRYTEVYIKTGNRWKLASRHANRMP